MNALVVYDSEFGNTERVAKTIGSSVGSSEEVLVKRVGEAKMDDLEGIELVIVGSPTQRFRPTPATKDFLNVLPHNKMLLWWYRCLK